MTTAFLAAIGLLQGSKPALSILQTKTLVGVHVNAMAAAPTGNKVAVAMEDNSIRIYDAATRTVIKTLTGHPRPVLALAWSKDGKLLASGDESARIFVWSTATWAKKNEIRPHNRAIQALDFNSATTQLLSTGADDKVMLFNLNSMKKPVGEFYGKGANYYSAKFGPKPGQFEIATLANGARSVNAKGSLVQAFVAHEFQGCLDVDSNKAGTWLVSGGKDARVALFEVKTAKRLGYYKGHSDWVIGARFAPNGKYVISSSVDRTVQIWNPYNFQAVVKIDDCSMVGSPFAVTGTGKYLLTTDSSDNLRVHELSFAIK